MKPYLYAIGAVLCWASLPAATGSGLEGFSTEELMFYSFSAAALYLYVQRIVLSGDFRLSLPGKRACLLGIWGIFLYHYMYYKALDNAPLAEGAILTTTWSFWIVVFSSTLAEGRLRLPVVLTALVGLLGAGLVIASGKELSFDAAHLKGYAIALGCGLVWSSFSVSLPRLKLRQDPMTVFTILAALISGVLFIFTMPHEVPAVKPLLSAVYLGTVPLGLSFYLWNRALTSGNLSIIGFLSYFTPPLAVLMVALVHKQHIPFQVIVGMAVILCASVAGKFFVKTA